MIKGIIFDKDGTLFDYDATWGAWTRQMLEAETGGDPVLFERLADVLGYDAATATFRPDSMVIASTAGELADMIQSVLPEVETGALLSRMNAAAAEVPQIEVVPLQTYFTGLRALGLRLGIATNDAEAPARAHLDRAGVTAHFDFIAGYDSGYGGKPAPGQLQIFCAQTGLEPAHCLMVGDSTHDLRAGQAAGMRTVGVLTGPAATAELAPFADVVLPDIGAIPDWLIAENLFAH
ncbi:phosphoglycolate phosphatase [Yoonia maricola]|uniref:phosphoglycolate phosphatase n=1 Tax=Yoonia maricola TaxID=420999 RepID=A0A2M8W280_9RHOB|nr:HAD family hydrolase [Yoonia maricola]PJI85026.1 phosphoglycolate phosphatase [Yoonia maricola]